MKIKTAVKRINYKEHPYKTISYNFYPAVSMDLKDTDAAMIFQRIVTFIHKNMVENKHFYEGRYWTKIPRESLQQHCFWLSEDQIKRRLKKLKDNGYLIIGNFNKNKFDQTSWYAVGDNPIAQAILKEEMVSPTEFINRDLF